MRETVGSSAVRAHFVLVAAIGLTGIGLLLIVGSAMLDHDRYSRDMALLGAIITAPIWITGMLAVVDAASVVRDRQVSRRRALAWALAAIVAGAFLANALGHLGIVGALLTEPHRVTMAWPASVLVSRDGLGADYFYVDQPSFWAPIVALLLGMVSLVAVTLDARPRRAAPANFQTP